MQCLDWTGIILMNYYHRCVANHDAIFCYAVLPRSLGMSHGSNDEKRGIRNLLTQQSGRYFGDMSLHFGFLCSTVLLNTHFSSHALDIPVGGSQCEQHPWNT